MKKWAELPPAYQAAFEAAAAEANMHMLSEYDARNPPALMRLVRTGVKLHPFPHDMLVAARKAAFEMYDEEAAKNPAFRKIYVEWKKFRDLSIQWFKVAEASYANFLYSGK
jgi:TRAP-type mannitol/chloroaromatic compound transport system substrate-binding protein